MDESIFWGPYLSQRQWGTVREDYSENGNSWEHVSYEGANSHAYKSGEDGLMGASDKLALLCFSVALWNGKDPFLKERLFGLTGKEGNHGEDIKELYYYLDNVPDHSYMRALYKYPHCAFLYSWLREENRRRDFHCEEFGLMDTGIFDEGGHWDVQVEYAKSDRLGFACHLEITNIGRHHEVLHLIPQFWFRQVQFNELVPHLCKGHTEPIMKASSDESLRIIYHFGQWRVIFYADTDAGKPVLLFTDNILPTTESPDRAIYTKDSYAEWWGTVWIFPVFFSKSFIKNAFVGRVVYLRVEFGVVVQGQSQPPVY